MPGGRLTQQERQQIALGLGDGLAYAEIARRLDRPTSTITREVLRNGGPTGYRADLAHRATERRAHRRRPAAPRGTQPADGADTDATQEYRENFTTLLMQQGLPKMTARVLTCLFTSDTGSMTAAELARYLQISPASVSKAVAFLEGQGLVGRERDEHRRERYVVDNDVWYRSMIASARGHARFAEAARQGVEVFDGPAAIRLQNIARFMDFIGESITRAANQAREVLSTEAREVLSTEAREVLNTEAPDHHD
ncbi:helix-turn-helix domain-containing protein [Actinocatenispora sera]|uniref:helix-turn-helix domain-containing protein n=1 Tax=Actinocatenispora sera TaxID=390989 RepID=UPI00068F70AF|nr:helix-turn-helix domain-containing protein [Actinocatenispora sera]